MTQCEELHTATPSTSLTHFSSKVWDNVLFELGSERVNSWPFVRGCVAYSGNGGAKETEGGRDGSGAATLGRWESGHVATVEGGGGEVQSCASSLGVSRSVECREKQGLGKKVPLVPAAPRKCFATELIPCGAIKCLASIARFAPSIFPSNSTRTEDFNRSS